MWFFWKVNLFFWVGLVSGFLLDKWAWLRSQAFCAVFCGCCFFLTSGFFREVKFFFVVGWLKKELDFCFRASDPRVCVLRAARRKKKS